jgi:hypothetical protein
MEVYAWLVWSTQPDQAEGVKQMRILVTGSRWWPDPWAFESTLAKWLGPDKWDEEYGMPIAQFTIVHGGCPTGLDWIADEWSINSFNPVEVHYADWANCDPERCLHRTRVNSRGEEYCPAAGIMRNQKMVDLGADVCLAFPMGESRGTNDCIRRARLAGIEVIQYAGPINPNPMVVKWNEEHRRVR